MSTVSIPKPSLLRQDATVISLVGLAHGTSHFFHLVLPPLFPWFMKEYSLSYTQVGGLTSVFFTMSGIGQAIAGFLVDRWGAHRVLFLGMALLACSGLFIASATGLPGLYAAAFIAGLGNSVFHPADFALLNHRVSQPRLGYAFSVHGLSGNLGWAAGSALMAGTAATFGSRAAGLVATLAGATALATVFWRRVALIDSIPKIEEAQPRSSARVADLLKLRLTWVAFIFFFFATFGFGALQNFTPSLLRDLYGLSLPAASSALTVYLIGGAAGLATGAFLTGGSRGQEKLVGLAFIASSTMALLLASLVAPRWAVFGVMALMGYGIGIAGPSRDMLVRKSAMARLGTGAFGRIYGLVYSGADVGLASAPLIFGMLMDAGHARWVFAGVGGSLLLAVIAAQAIAAEGARPSPAA